jgi:Cu+-exporting ATPase
MNPWSPASRCRSRRKPARCPDGAGTVNQSGALILRADKVGRDTMLARIVRWWPMHSARARPSSAWPTRFGLVRAGRHRWRRVVAFAIWAIFGPRAATGFTLVAAVAVLIIACPARSAWPRRCRSWSASDAARSLGVLIKNAEALERMEKVDTLVVDKTGTLTEGTGRD